MYIYIILTVLDSGANLIGFAYANKLVYTHPAPFTKINNTSGVESAKRRGLRTQHFIYIVVVRGNFTLILFKLQLFL